MCGCWGIIPLQPKPGTVTNSQAELVGINLSFTHGGKGDIYSHLPQTIIFTKQV